MFPNKSTILISVFCLSSAYPGTSARFDFLSRLDFSNNSEIRNWTWPEIESLVRNSVDTFLFPNIGVLLKIPTKLKLSKGCQTSYMKVVLAARKIEPWVIRMVDAMGKVPSGILDGTVVDFGAFDECLNLRFGMTYGGAPVKGKYCMIKFRNPLISMMAANSSAGGYVEAYGKPPKWVEELFGRADGFLKLAALWFGMCVPSTCSQEDVLKINVLAAHPLGTEVTVADCQTDEKQPLENYQIISISVLVAIVIVCFIGTATDIFSWHRCKKSEALETTLLADILKSFSLVSNTKRLFLETEHLNSLPFFNAFRIISAAWIILLHTCLLPHIWSLIKYKNVIAMKKEIEQLPFAITENFPIPIQTFFFMSGCLITFTKWTELENNKGRTILRFFIHKFFRFTATFAVAVLLLFVIPLTDAGPLWNIILRPEVEVCREQWWKNILFVSNWWDPSLTCLPHTWFLSSLMQAHVIGVILLLFAFRWPIWGCLTGLMIAFSSCIVIGLQVGWHNFEMPVIAKIDDFSDLEKYVKIAHSATHAHLTCYLIGMVVGYVILKYSHVKMRKLHQILGWIVASMCALASVFGVYGLSSSTIASVVFVVLHRLGWAAALGWLSFACANNRTGLICSCLSWKGFRPLGTLSYSLYLLHPLVIVYRHAALKERVYYGCTELLFAFSANVTISLLLAYALFVTVEAPLGNLEKLFSKKCRRKDKYPMKSHLSQRAAVAKTDL